MSNTPLTMPKMSMTMTEGEVIAWHVEEGKPFRRGDVLCEVLTDKVDMEVEAPEDGTLVQIIVREGVVPVGEPIALLEIASDDLLGGLFDAPPEGDATESFGDSLPTARGRHGDGSHQPGSSPIPETRTPSAQTEPPPAVPRARALAREHQVDLTMVAGTGPGGRVLVSDVEQVIGMTASAQTAPAAAAVAAAVPPSQARARAVRSAVARVMSASAAVPQFTVWRDLDLGAANLARTAHGSRLSWTTVLLRAYAAALRRTPALLTQWTGEETQPLTGLAIGLAVDTPHGLLVPVFSEPDRGAASSLDVDVRQTVTAARGGRIDAAHLVPAAATLSNLGGLGVDRFQALLTPPQPSVLALGTISERPVAVPGGIGLGLRVSAGLTVDHRVADGADGGRLLAAMAELLAAPEALL